jgi:hypothetical protein
LPTKAGVAVGFGEHAAVRRDDGHAAEGRAPHLRDDGGEAGVVAALAQLAGDAVDGLRGGRQDAPLVGEARLLHAAADEESGDDRADEGQEDVRDKDAFFEHVDRGEGPRPGVQTGTGSASNL